MTTTIIELVKRDELSQVLYSILEKGGEDASFLESLFAPICECSVADELRKRINEADVVLLELVKRLIAAPVYPLPKPIGAGM